MRMRAGVLVPGVASRSLRSSDESGLGVSSGPDLYTKVTESLQPELRDCGVTRRGGQDCRLLKTRSSLSVLVCCFEFLLVCFIVRRGVAVF